MSNAKQKLVEYLKSKHGATQAEAEVKASELANEILGEEREKIKAELEKKKTGIKARIKRLAGLK